MEDMRSCSDCFAVVSPTFTFPSDIGIGSQQEEKEENMLMKAMKMTLVLLCSFGGNERRPEKLKADISWVEEDVLWIQWKFSAKGNLIIPFFIWSI